MEQSPIHILLVEDNPGDARLLRETLREVPAARFALAHVERLDQALRSLAEKRFDVVLLDLSLPDSQGLETCAKVHAGAPLATLVVLTGLDDETVAVQALQNGAQDYLVKGQVDGNMLMRSMRYAIERTRRLDAERALLANEKEFRFARAIQQRLFPATAPELPGFDISGASFPAVATGGDYFDYIPLPKDCLGVVVGDVCGHGFGPALLMAEVRAYLRALALTRGDIGEMVALVNRALFFDTAAGDFATLLLARLDPHARTLLYTSAGHMTGYILDAAGKVKTLLEGTSVPLGIEPDVTFKVAPLIQLEPGDLIFLLTDGIVEVCGPDSLLFGIDRTLAVIRTHQGKSAREIIEALYTALRGYSGDRPPQDDMTAIVLKVKDSPTGNHADGVGSGSTG
jgi:serine phosphatase RsbU (regulator of sigma subunit)